MTTMHPPTIEGEGIVSDMPIVQDALKGDHPVNDELFAQVLDNVTDMYMDAERDAELQSMFGNPLPPIYRRGTTSWIGSARPSKKHPSWILCTRSWGPYVGLEPSPNAPPTSVILRTQW